MMAFVASIRRICHTAQASVSALLMLALLALTSSSIAQAQADVQEPATETAPASAEKKILTPLERIIVNVRWQALATPDTPWRLCVLGETDAITPIFANTRISGHQVQVLSIHNTSELAHCQLLDLRQSSDSHAIGNWLDAARNLPLLTVGQGPNFCSRGGHFCFTGDELRPLELNLSSAQAVGFRINARVLAPDEDKAPE